MSSEEKIPAPALERGIRALQLLSEHCEMSLDELSQNLKVPKASMLRMLNTLIKMGLVDKFSNKTYQSKVKFLKLDDQEIRHRKTIESVLEELCQLVLFTVEWYTANDLGMVIEVSKWPNPERRIVAGEGFVRAWQSELDAVALLGYAFFYRGEAQFRGCWGYNSNGERVRYGEQKSQQMVSKTVKKQSAFDENFNLNGVRRMAKVVFEKEKPIGVLAIAERMTVSSDPKARELRKALDHFSKRLEMLLVESS